jgi:hypothetical protein
VIALALLLQLAPPADWSGLPLLPVPERAGGFDPSPFVRDEVAAGRCKASGDATGAQAVTAAVAVLVGPAGAVQRIVPQAIDCPTVEQFTVGYVLTLTRRAEAGERRPGWYRYTVTYRWTG